MAVPSMYPLMLPVLESLAGGKEEAKSDVRSRVAAAEGLTADDLLERTRGGTATKFNDRVDWCLRYLAKAGLVENPRRGVFQVTPDGSRLLSRDPDRIDESLLREYPSFAAWRGQGGQSLDPPSSQTEHAETPEETLERATEQLRAEVEAEVLARVRSAPPEFLEQAIVDLLIAMGYGGGDADMGRVTGRAGDGGIDGTIREDALGLDEVYVQAKRYADGSTVGEGDLRNFAGAIDAAGTTKGVFVTTASFTRAARGFAERSPKRIVLIDGDELARLMVEHGVGARKWRSFEVKRIDEDYFDQ